MGSQGARKLCAFALYLTGDILSVSDVTAVRRPMESDAESHVAPPWLRESLTFALLLYLYQRKNTLGKVLCAKWNYVIGREVIKGSKISVLFKSG
ncbi:hypothetical protein NPIL_264921 [Nephila pilipes]|uniref:Uncharacterized protein n=1 Tax=Nephila pilipes TaxID=299642 RepID=A0A8X6NUM7_NEPPI|nr:hypothetical protein NPIL_264921 [Nephila pilipes]